MSKTSAAARIANDSPFCESRRSMKKLEDDLLSPEAMHASLSEIERMMRTEGQEMLRAIMQAHFDGRSERELPVAVRGEDGIDREGARAARRTVMTEFGEVELERNLYQAPGVTGRAPLDPAKEQPRSWRSARPATSTRSTEIGCARPRTPADRYEAKPSTRF